MRMFFGCNPASTAWLKARIGRPRVVFSLLKQPVPAPEPCDFARPQAAAIGAVAASSHARVGGSRSGERLARTRAW